MHENSLHIPYINIYIVIVNNRYTEDTQINTLVPTLSPQLLLQIEITLPYSNIPIKGTAYSIVDLC